MRLSSGSESEGRHLAIPRIGGPKDFWNRIKSISVAEIAREANRPLSIALVGGPGDGDGQTSQQLIDSLYASAKGTENTPHSLPSTPYLQIYPSMAETDGYPQTPDVFDFVIDVGGGRTGARQDDKTTIYSIYYV